MAISAVPLVAIIMTRARTHPPVIRRVGGGHQAMFSTTCDGVVSYILQMVDCDFVSDHHNAQEVYPHYESICTERDEVCSRNQRFPIVSD